MPHTLMSPNTDLNQELVEFYWDERSGIAEYLWENQRTGELNSYQRSQPHPKPEITDDLRAKYFADLLFWLNTQPMYD